MSQAIQTFEQSYQKDVPSKVFMYSYSLQRIAVCTDLSLSVQQVLKYYQKRWPVEVDNFYLKEALGLGDFRLQSYAAIQKWFAVVVLAMNYLQLQAATLYEQTLTLYTPADLIRQHRLGHLQTLLRKLMAEAIQTGKSEELIAAFLPLPDWAVT